MAEETTRLVPVKLPGGNQVQVKVPTQWGPDQIRAELVKRGVLPGETPADTPAQEIPPAQPLTAQDVAVAAKRAVNAGVTQFWHDMNEADRLLRSAVRGTDEEGASMGVARRAGRGALAFLHGTAAPFTAVAKAFGTNVEDTALELGANPKVARVLAESTELTALIFSGGGANAVKKAVVQASAKNPLMIENLLNPAYVADRSQGQVLAQITSDAAKHKKIPKEEVFQAIEKLSDRMDPVLAAAITKTNAAPLTKIGLARKGFGKIPAEAPLTAVKISDDTLTTITQGAADALAGNLDSSKRIFENIFRAIKHEGFVPAELKAVMEHWGISPAQLAEEYKHAVSRAGHLLQEHSKVAKALEFAFDDPAAKAVWSSMRKSHPDLMRVTVGDQIMRVVGGATNFWRSMLTTQLATSIRNVIGGGAHYSLEVAGSVLYDIVGGATKIGKGKYKQGLNEMFTSLNAAIRTGAALTIEKRALLQKVLDSPQARDGLYRMRLISQPMGDLHLSNKVSFYANTFNRWQEFFVRGAAMEFKLRTLLARQGQKLELVAGTPIDEQILKESVDFARKVTFAADGQKGQLKDLIRIWGRSPLSPALLLINPFPQFTFGNAIPFVIHKGTFGISHILNGETRTALGKLMQSKKMSVSESERLASIMTDAATGTALYWSAWNVRQAEYLNNPDSKWNELTRKDGTKVDTRPFGPYAAWLFLSEVMQRPERLTFQDFVEASIGMSRLAGTPLILSDLFRGKEAWQNWNTVQKFAGAIMGGFSTPLRTVRDMVEFDMAPEDAILRDTRQDPILGPFLNSLPIFNRDLPIKYSPLRAGKLVLTKPDHKFNWMGREYNLTSPMLRQLTGISENVKSDLQRRVDILQLDQSKIFPRTGNAQADNLVAKAQGYFMARITPGLLPQLDRMTPALQRMVLARTFAASKAYGRGLLAAQFPRLYMEIKALKTDEDLMQIMTTFNGINPYLATDQEMAKRGFKAPDLQRGIFKGREGK